MDGSAVTIASLLTEAGTFFTSGIGVVWDLMTANPMLSLFTGAGLVSLGIGFFVKIKRVARR